MNTELAIECLVAVTGLYPSNPVSSVDVEKARKIPKETAEAVREFFDLTKNEQPAKSPTISYLATWKRLNQKHDDRKASALISDHEVASAYVGKLGEVREYVKSKWRPSKIVTMMGDKLLPPAVSAVFPEFYAMVGVFIDEEMFRRRVRRKSYEVPYMQEVAIKAYLGETLAAEVETINAETQPAEMEAPPEFDIETRDRRAGMTRADRVEEGNASG